MAEKEEKTQDEKAKELLDEKNKTDWTQVPQDQPSESYGLMSRIIGVFIEPDKAFRFIGQKPEIWGAIIFTFVVLLIAGLFTMNQMSDLAVNAATEQLAKASPDMPTEQIEVATKVTSIMTKLSFVTGTIQILVMWVIFALLAYIVGLFLGQEASFKSSLAVIAYSSLPAVLIKQGVIATIVFMGQTWTSLADFQQAMMRSSASLYSFLGNPEMSAVLRGFLLVIDPFLIWSLFLMAIGFKWANNVKASHGWRIAIILTIISVIAGGFLASYGLKQLDALG